MNRLMNLMNLMKRFGGCTGYEKKHAIFFPFEGCKMSVLGSLMFICFIKSVLGQLRGCANGLGGGFLSNLMNLMNVEVVRILNGFFENIASFMAGIYDPNLMRWFIKVHKFSTLPPLPFGHLPQMGERNLGEDGIGGVL